MSMNKQLSKEARFAYKVFQAAAQKAGGYKIPQSGCDQNVIIAGGAIRDLYFDRPSRDVDIYYNATAISASGFATALKNLDIAKMARDAGFESVSVTRLSDGSKMGKDTSPAGNEEDWGDVSDDQKAILEAFADRYVYFIQSGVNPSLALIQAHGTVTSANNILLGNLRANSYVRHVIQRLQGRAQGSAGGNKMGKAHPLKSVEEFRIVLDDRIYVEIELMGVESKPVDYVMSHFAVKLSRAYYDGQGVHFTSEFMSDARNKTITVACPVQHARFDRLFSYYLPKMKKYFPDFDVRIDLNAMNGRDW